MNKYFLVDAIEGIEDLVKNLYGDLSYAKCMLCLPSDFRQSVRMNKRFKNLHQGQRCFIIGNGPSLKMQDLSHLDGEVIFTVNQASRNPQIRNLKPMYHFWIDPIFFSLDENKPEDMEVLQTYKDLYTEDNRPITFLPQQAYAFVNKFNLKANIDIQYFAGKVMMGKKYKKDFDFTRAVPSFGTVVQTCIAMACYMGFKKIYLLGCDTTGIITMINGAIDYNDAQYSYSISENERKRMHEMYSNPNYLKTSISGFVELLDSYTKLNIYAKEHQIELYNCSAKTILTSIPRMEYSHLFD